MKSQRTPTRILSMRTIKRLILRLLVKSAKPKVVKLGKKRNLMLDCSIVLFPLLPNPEWEILKLPKVTPHPSVGLSVSEALRFAAPTIEIVQQESPIASINAVVDHPNISLHLTKLLQLLR